MSRERLSASESVYDQIWILTNRTAKPFAAMFGQRHALNLTEWRILRIVARNPGTTAQDIADYTGLDKMSVSRAVRALESAGRLERRGGEQPGRTLSLFPTRSGLALFTEISEQAKVRDRQVFGVLSAAEAAAFESTLRKLLDSSSAPLDPPARR